MLATHSFNLSNSQLSALNTEIPNFIKTKHGTAAYVSFSHMANPTISWPANLQKLSTWHPAFATNSFYLQVENELIDAVTSGVLPITKKNTNSPASIESRPSFKYTSNNDNAKPRSSGLNSRSRNANYMSLLLLLTLLTMWVAVVGL